MKIFRILGMMAAAVLLGAQAFGGEATLAKEGDSGYRIGNGRITALIDAVRGGNIVSYKDKLGGDVELLSNKGSSGLCMDHFQSQLWPGEMMDAKYEVTGQSSDGKTSTVSLRYEVTGEWHTQSDAQLRGLLLEKTYTLRADSPAIECDIKITAPKKESKLFAYWQQHIFFAGGHYDIDADKTFRPSARGVRIKAGENWGYTGREIFIHDMSAGWMALLDVRAKTGLAFLSDYNELNALYTAGGNDTIEAMYRMTYLPAGQSTEYQTYVVPVVGMDNVVSATPDYVLGYRMKSDGKGTGQIAISAIRSVNSPESLSLKVDLTGIGKPQRLTPVGTVSFAALGEQVQTKELSFSGAAEDPLVLKVSAEAKSAAGAATSYAFADYYNGIYSWGENITTDMQTPVWRAEPPAQKLSLRKPEPLKLKAPWELTVWYAEGLLDANYGMADLMHLICVNQKPTGGDRYDKAYTSYSQNWQTQLTSFPYDYDRLLSYRMIILGGVKKESLGNVGQEMLCDYVKAGGGLLVLGGPAAYGASHLAGTPLAELLPVSFAPDPYDLQPVKEGVLKPTAAGASILEDLDWSAAPTAFYVHKVEVKPWGRTLLEVNGRPFLVVGEIGPAKARVACILGAPMGEFDGGPKPFWKWNDWKYLARDVSWWVLKDDRRFETAPHL